MIDLTVQERAFLIGLEQLTRETGIYIGGCGCCGSPFIQNVEAYPADESGYVYENSVQWIDPSDEYDWEHYKDQIVKPLPIQISLSTLTEVDDEIQ